MSSGLVTAAYIVAAILFIFSLAGLSKQETAKRGCYSGIAGMAVALFVTVFSDNTHGLGWIIIAMLIGAAIGIHKAKKVEMTEMPELIALLHSFVGLAAVLVGFNSYIEPGNVSHDMHTIHLVEVYLGIFIGAVTFTGSLKRIRQTQRQNQQQPAATARQTQAQRTGARRIVCVAARICRH